MLQHENVELMEHTLLPHLRINILAERNRYKMRILDKAVLFSFLYSFRCNLNIINNNNNNMKIWWDAQILNRC